MPIYEIQLIDERTGKTRGYKFVQASSPHAIKSNPSRHVGPGVRIGKIYGHTAKTLLGARRMHAKQNGYRVKNSTRIYGYPKQRTKGKRSNEEFGGINVTMPRMF